MDNLLAFGHEGRVSVFLALQVAVAWVGLLFLIHRLNVRRLRAQARLVALRRLDWDALLGGLLPPPEEGAVAALPSTLPDGAPTPEFLRYAPSPTARPRHAVLVGLVSGANFKDPQRVFEDAGFSGGEVRWLCTLSRLRADPEGTLRELESRPVGSAAELYLREYLVLIHGARLFNLELLVLGSRGRLGQGISRFGEAPALHLCRALAASLVGWNQVATSDLARAVYFSRMAGFYLRAVLDTPWLEEARPELVLQCRKAWDTRQATNRSESLPKRGSAE